MSELVAGSKPHQLKTIGLWILKGVLALLFVAAATAKLVGAPMMVAEFKMVGLGQWLRYVTAAMEICGAVLLLWPGRTVFGALVLACVGVGAFFAQLLAIHMDVMHTIILTAVLLAIAYAHRAQLPLRG